MPRVGWKTVRKEIRHFRARVLASRRARATDEQFDAVERFCLFVGFPRSGSSLFGQLLNAHRHVVIANEIDAVRNVREGITREKLFAMIVHRDRELVRNGLVAAGGYYLGVPGQWQGRYDQLRVIGDKKAGGTTVLLRRWPELLGELQATVGVPVKVITIVRNPFDNISTWAERKRVPVSAVIDDYFSMAATVDATRRALGPDDWLEVHHEALVADPRRELAAASAFLGVDAPDDYLDACADLVFPSPHRTRDSKEWTADLIAKVEAQAARHSFLRDYSFA